MRRFTPRPRCSSTRFTSRFLPSRRPTVSQSVRALHAIELRLDRAVDHAVDGDAAAKLVELRLVDLAVRAHAVAAEPAGGGKLQHAREPAVVGEEQQALGVDVEPADRHDARHVRGQGGEDGRRGPPGRGWW